jgi:nucleotide-binding universal stress UspA family protein
MTPQREPAVRIAKILFATDFSEVSAKALPYAAAFARRFAAELCVVHVLGDGEPQQDTAAVAQLRREAEARTNRLLEGAHFRGVRHQVVLAEGEILPALASVAEQRGADLLVLGMHGRHGLAKALLGSVADEILRLAQVPVLVVGSEVSVPAEEELRVHRVLYAADFSPGCGRALQYAGAIAQAEHARLLVLHVVEDIWKEPTSTRLRAEEYLRVRLLEEGWMASIDPVEPELLIDFGPAEDRIVQQAEQHGVELIVLDVPSTTHPVLSAHLPGPLAYNVASHARCPVLAVRGVTVAITGEI